MAPSSFHFPKKQSDRDNRREENSAAPAPHSSPRLRSDRGSTSVPSSTSDSPGSDSSALPNDSSVTTTRNRRHLRSPSNPVDFSRNVCWSVVKNGKSATQSSLISNDNNYWTDNSEVECDIAAKMISREELNKKLRSKVIEMEEFDPKLGDCKRLINLSNVNASRIPGSPSITTQQSPLLINKFQSKSATSVSFTKNTEVSEIISSQITELSLRSAKQSSSLALMTSADDCEGMEENTSATTKSLTNLGTGPSTIQNSIPGSYELKLLKQIPCGPLFPLLVEITLSPVVSNSGGTDFTATRRFAFAMEAGYNRESSAATSFGPWDSHQFPLGCGRVDPNSSDSVFARHMPHFNGRSNLRLTSPEQADQRLHFSRNCLLQVMVRNPEDGVVADVFVLRIDLSDMPPDTRTILRQKSYKEEQQQRTTDDPDGSAPSAARILVKMIEIPIVRSWDGRVGRHRIRLAGAMRLAFSFNRGRSAAIQSHIKKSLLAKSASLSSAPVSTSSSSASINQNLNIDKPAKTHTVFSKEAYFPLNFTHLQEGKNERSFQHGSLCL